MEGEENVEILQMGERKRTSYLRAAWLREGRGEPRQERTKQGRGKGSQTRRLEWGFPATCL